jgi:hypothetical protein
MFQLPTHPLSFLSLIRSRSPPPSPEYLHAFDDVMWMRALNSRIDDEARMPPRDEPPEPDNELPSANRSRASR